MSVCDYCVCLNQFQPNFDKHCLFTESIIGYMLIIQKHAGRRAWVGVLFYLVLDTPVLLTSNVVYSFILGIKYNDKTAVKYFLIIVLIWKNRISFRTPKCRKMYLNLPYTFLILSGNIILGLQTKTFSFHEIRTNPREKSIKSVSIFHSVVTCYLKNWFLLRLDLINLYYLMNKCLQLSTVPWITSFHIHFKKLFIDFYRPIFDSRP